MSNLNKEYWQKRAELAEYELLQLYISFSEAIKSKGEITNIQKLEKIQVERRAFISSDTTIYEENTWISVEERLPKNDFKVLVINQFGVCFIMWLDAYCDNMWIYNSKTVKGTGIQFQPTHWMPLPNKPL